MMIRLFRLAAPPSRLPPHELLLHTLPEITDLLHPLIPARVADGWLDKSNFITANHFRQTGPSSEPESAGVEQQVEALL